MVKNECRRFVGSVFRRKAGQEHDNIAAIHLQDGIEANFITLAANRGWLRVYESSSANNFEISVLFAHENRSQILLGLSSDTIIRLCGDSQ